jgi:hypothetical protein
MGVNAYPVAMGRPSGYTPELADRICAHVAAGSNINNLPDEPDMPHYATVYNWLREFPDFFEKYARAREFRAFARVDRMDDITKRTLSGEIAPDVARVVIDAEKWQAGKENRGVFGDKTAIEHKHSGAVGLITGSLEGFNTLVQNIERQRGDLLQDATLQE